MSIHPRPDQELAIQEAIRAGWIQNETDILDIGIDVLFKRQQEGSPMEVVDRLASFGKRHNLTLGGATIKDLIDEGRL